MEPDRETDILSKKEEAHPAAGEAAEVASTISSLSATTISSRSTELEMERSSLPTTTL
ncbi:hypothetical protein KIN20_033035 [Parelaphostrongylus tenuis]|uniref:Uncharacterized protein n=1 Tax=Parelaphostrongylus tenuis TaxID=148309 RepID=A0AAD5WHX6_PARTN|nr:hypothetical protein KIN20_033035 [Parelaphostrongylus tenuis]